jgi:hypothetical protein
MTTKGGVVVPPLFFAPEKGMFRSCGSDQRRRLWKLLSEGTRRVAGAVLFPAGNKTAPLSKCVPCHSNKPQAVVFALRGKSPPPSMGACFRSRSLIGSVRNRGNGNAVLAALSWLEYPCLCLCAFPYLLQGRESRPVSPILLRIRLCRL